MLNDKGNFKTEGYTVVEAFYTSDEINQIVKIIDELTPTSPTFRKHEQLFAIRQILKEAPQLTKIIFNQKLTKLIDEVMGKDYFVTKSIYFDKPPASNWFVSYHQDLTISVNARATLTGFDNWTVKQGQYAVQPPLAVLDNCFTLRIHLDDTDEQNGALKVIPASHQKGIYRAEHVNWAQASEVFCKVNRGGIMLMKPLLLHASNRTTNQKRRRVIHIEFSNVELPSEIQWAERMVV